jgi:hypothetical protein
MGSRLYYATTTPAISPTQSASWTITSTFVRGQLSSAKRNTALVLTTRVKTAADVHDQNRLVLQCVSRPLRAQTITGTVKGQMLVSESNGAVGGHSQMIVRVLSKDGSSVTGTLYAGVTATGEGADPTSEWAVTTLTNRALPRGGATAVIHLPSLVLGGIIAGSLAVSGLAANAQQDTTPTTTETDVAIGAYSFTYDQKEPFLAFPVSRTTSGDGAFVTWFAAAELASGEVTGLTRAMTWP